MTDPRDLDLADYAVWRAEFDAELKARWCITVADAGFDDELLVRYWTEGGSGAEAARELAEKYDLVELN